MKATLVFYEPLVEGRQANFGFASVRLAQKLQELGLLEKVICRTIDPAVDLPRDKVAVMHHDGGYRLRARLIGRAGRMFPWLDARRMAETLFDRFAARQLPPGGGGRLFATRPLMLDTFRRARAAGTEVWLMASVPHPLQNYALGRNEEWRHGLKREGPITDEKRTERLTRAIQLADRIVTSHPSAGEYVHRSFVNFEPPRKLLLLKRYFPLDPAEYAAEVEPAAPDPARSGVDFLHISHMHFLKGIVYTLDAWRRFKERDRSDSRLLLVGVVDRRLRDLIDRDYADLPGVEFRGYAADLMPHYREADVFVSPSVTDAGPVTIIEALAAGLPVISSRNCGFASILREGEDGLTYEFNDVRRLADHFAWFVESRSRIPEMSRRARENARSRSIEEYVEELAALFERKPAEG